MSIFTKAIVITIAALLLLVLVRTGLALVPDQIAERAIRSTQLSAVTIGIVLEFWAIAKLTQASVGRTAVQPPSSSCSDPETD